MTTTADIDVALVAAHWRQLHASWAEDVDEMNRAAAELDLLLELRHHTAAHGRSVG